MLESRIKVVEQQLQHQAKVIEQQHQQQVAQSSVPQTHSLPAAPAAAPYLLARPPPPPVVYQGVAASYKGDGFEYAAPTPHGYDPVYYHGGYPQQHATPSQSFGLNYPGGATGASQSAQITTVSRREDYVGDLYYNDEEEYDEYHVVDGYPSPQRILPSTSFVGQPVKLNGSAGLASQPAMQPGFFGVGSALQAGFSPMTIGGGDKPDAPAFQTLTPFSVGKTTPVASNSNEKATMGRKMDPCILNQSGSEGPADDGDDSYQEPHFEAIVNLPEVSITTGEEDETVWFAERVKLFRFAEKQWKERGLGVIKMLCNESTKHVRVLMRREQIFKVCANHLIKADMSIDFKSPDDRLPYTRVSIALSLR